LPGVPLIGREVIMFKWLRNWIRPIKCLNFDCENEWDGVCKKRKIRLGVTDATKPEMLFCRDFRQVRNG